MAEPQSQRAIRVELQCHYDRYARERLAQVYRILVPPENSPIEPTAEDLSHEKERGHLCQSFLGSAMQGKQIRILPVLQTGHVYTMRPRLKPGLSSVTASR